MGRRIRLTHNSGPAGSWYTPDPDPPSGGGGEPEGALLDEGGETLLDESGETLLEEGA